MRRWASVALLAGCAFAVGCSDDGTPANHLLLWLVPNPVAPGATALVVADVSHVARSKNGSGCVVVVAGDGSLSQLVPVAAPAKTDMGGPQCVAPKCVTALTSQDGDRRAYATYRAPGNATTDTLAALFYDGALCPPPLATSPTVQTAVIISVGPTAAPTDAGTTMPDLSASVDLAADVADGGGR